MNGIGNYQTNVNAKDLVKELSKEMTAKQYESLDKLAKEYFPSAHWIALASMMMGFMIASGVLKEKKP